MLVSDRRAVRSLVRWWVLLPALSAVALALTACGGPSEDPVVVPATTASAAATTGGSSTGPTVVSGPMTGPELVWLEGIFALHQKMDGIMTGSSVVTDDSMRSMAKKFARCGSELDRLGSVSERLQPAGDLARQACQAYEKTAKCFADADTCGFDEMSRGSSLFAEAEIKGERIKEAAAGQLSNG